MWTFLAAPRLLSAVACSALVGGRHRTGRAGPQARSEGLGQGPPRRRQAGRARPRQGRPDQLGRVPRRHRPPQRDSDRDGISDALENRDRDGLVNADEIAAGTDPRKRDSDGDRIPDGREDRDRDGLLNADERPTGHDFVKRDTDADGVLDGADNAGKVTAVSATSVTIRLLRRRRP